MISLLTGTLIDKDLERAVIDAGGVGYEVLMPMPDLAGLGAVGQRTTVHVHTYVREDTLRLYGFRERSAKLVFEKLIAVSGVGPKLAIALLSGVDNAELALAVEAKDVARLSKVPGIGKKTAERLCLELRDKLAPPPGPATSTAELVSTDLVQALESLGYRPSQVEKVIASLDDLVKDGASLEELVREALNRMHKVK